MKGEYKILLLALVAGLFIWVIDTVLDYWVFLPGHTFWSLLLAEIPAHEIWMRSLAVAGILTFGIILSIVWARRRQAKETLRQESSRARAYLDIAEVMLLAVNQNGEIALINPKGCRVLGFEEGELLGKDWFDTCLPPRIRDEVKAVHQKVTAGDISHVEYFENPVMTKSGEERTIAWHNALLTDEEGNVIGSLSSGEDITERKRAEEALKESEESYRLLLGSITDGLQVQDRELRYVLVNDELARMARMPKERLLGSKMTDLFPGVEETVFFKTYQKVIETGEPAVASDEFVFEDGRRAWFEVHAYPAPEGILVIVADITKRKRAEEALRASAYRWQTTFDALSDCVCVISLDGTIEQCNQATSRFLQKSRDEIVGRTCWELMHGASEPIEGCPFVRARETCRRETLVLPVGDRWLNVSVDPVLDEDGRIIAAVHVLSDITEHKRAEEEKRRLEEQVRQAQKLESLGVLAGGIAHDFNNLLTGVLGNADLALQELPPESPARYSIEQVHLAARRASELCRQMLAYSGRASLAAEPLSLNSVVEEMTHLLEAAIAKNVALNYDFTDDLPAVHGDPTQLRQVVMNLITNAADAIGDKSGFIAVRTGVMEVDRPYLAEAYLAEDLPEGFYVYLEVTDTGCGMDEETKAKLFDPFFTTKFTGRGLGMAAVLGIVRGHRGAIKVDSELGRGSTFRVLLPVSEKPAEPTGEDDGVSAAEWRGHGTVLVVDDEETVRALGKRVLEQSGFTILAAEDGREALRLFRQHANEIVLVLLDLTMPHTGGREALAKLRRIQPDVPVILLSGYAEEDALGQFGDTQATDFLHKPYRTGTLLAKVRQALETKNRDNT